jgi:hypothetical protein
MEEIGQDIIRIIIKFALADIGTYRALVGVSRAFNGHVRAILGDQWTFKATTANDEAMSIVLGFLHGHWPAIDYIFSYSVAMQILPMYLATMGSLNHDILQRLIEPCWLETDNPYYAISNVRPIFGYFMAANRGQELAKVITKVNVSSGMKKHIAIATCFYLFKSNGAIRPVVEAILGNCNITGQDSLEYLAKLIINKMSLHRSPYCYATYKATKRLGSISFIRMMNECNPDYYVELLTDIDYNVAFLNKLGVKNIYESLIRLKGHLLTETNLIVLKAALNDY